MVLYDLANSLLLKTVIPATAILTSRGSNGCSGSKGLGVTRMVGRGTSTSSFRVVSVVSRPIRAGSNGSDLVGPCIVVGSKKCS